MALRLSGTLAARPAAALAINAFYFATDASIVFESDGVSWSVREVLDHADIVGTKSGLLAARPEANQALGWIFRATDTGASYEGFPDGWFTLSTAPGVTKIVQIKDDDEAQTVTIFEALGASETNPLLLTVEQLINLPFVGNAGRFDLIERDPTDARRDVTVDTTQDSPIITSDEEDAFAPEDEGQMIFGDGIPFGCTILSVDSANQITLGGCATPGDPTMAKNATITDTGVTVTIGGRSEIILGTAVGLNGAPKSGNLSRQMLLVTAPKVYEVVFEPFSTDADYVGLDGVTATDTGLASEAAAFRSTDEGKSITGENIAADTTILSVTDAQTVVLSHATTGTGSNKVFTIHERFEASSGDGLYIVKSAFVN